MASRKEVEVRRRVAAADVERIDRLIAENARQIGKLQLVERDLEFQRRNAEAQITEADEWLEANP